MKWLKDEQIWSVAPLSIIQELKEGRNLLPVCVVVLEGIPDIWLETLLDLDYCRRVNNIWYYSGVKPIWWECTSDLEPSWLCWLLLQSALWFLNLNWGGKPCLL